MRHTAGPVFFCLILDSLAQCQAFTGLPINQLLKLKGRGVVSGGAASSQYLTPANSDSRTSPVCGFFKRRLESSSTPCQWSPYLHGSTVLRAELANAGTVSVVQPSVSPATSRKLTESFTLLYPVWTLVATAVALLKPGAFSWMTNTHFSFSLMAMSLIMGLALNPSDFAGPLKKPSPILLGLLGCYGLMPLLSKAIGAVSGLPSGLRTGLVFVGCINGAQASNLCTLIARGAVPLSILMTTLSTTLSVFATPVLTNLLMGTNVALDPIAVVRSTLSVVLGPMIAGMLINKASPKLVQKIRPVAPAIGVAVSCLLVGGSLSSVAKEVIGAGVKLQVLIGSFHVLGGLLGYLASNACGFSMGVSRTIAIETAMKSSALAFLLARKHIPDVMASIAPASSIVWMTLTGASMGVFWRLFDGAKPIN